MGITSQTQTTMSRKLCVATFVAAFIVVAFTADVAVEARKMLQSDDDGRLDETLLPVVNVEENGDDVKAVGGIENGVNAQSPSWQAPGGGEGGGQAPESWRDPNLISPPPAQQAPESWRDPNLMPPPAQQAPESWRDPSRRKPCRVAKVGWQQSRRRSQHDLDDGWRQQQLPWRRHHDRLVVRLPKPAAVDGIRRAATSSIVA